MRARLVSLGLLSGMLAAGAYYLPFGWPLIFVSLVPLLVAIQKARSWKGASLAGLVTGCVIVGATTFWMFDSQPLPPNFTLSPFVGFTAILVSWLLIMLFTAPFVAVWASVVQKLPRISGMVYPFLVAGLWVALVEFLRMYGFAVVTYAPDVRNPIFWSTGFLGYVLADNNAWLQFAAVGGVWLLSFIVVVVNTVIGTTLISGGAKNKKRVILGSVAAVIMLVSVAPLADVREQWWPKPSRVVPIGIMSLSASVPDSIEGIRQTNAAAAKAVAELSQQGAELIVLPEGEDLRTLLKHPYLRGFSATTTVIAAAPASGESGQKLLRGYATTFPEDVTDTLRNKLILTPQGEYLIGIFRYGLPLLGLSSAVERFTDTRTLATGGLGLPFVHEDVRASLMFCFEVFGADFGSQLVQQQQSQVITAMISHARFFISPILDADTLRMIAVRAVEAGVPLVVSTNNTPAYALDRYGRVIQSFGTDHTSAWGTVLLSVPMPKTKP